VERHNDSFGCVR
jgi:hypothetical protein